MRVVISSAAHKDLVDIIAWIARDSPARAKRYGRELHAAAVRIGSTPYISPPSDELLPGLRRRPHGSHVICYTIEPDRVFVRRILYGGRDFNAISW